MIGSDKVTCMRFHVLFLDKDQDRFYRFSVSTPTKEEGDKLIEDYMLARQNGEVPQDLLTTDFTKVAPQIIRVDKY